ncbi:MAG: hypothetical protein D6797_08440 [Bdellovibrio sp.]|nr:MAG: hypothetical protein D6797_08440 [Bdellovibrio sp.]
MGVKKQKRKLRNFLLIPEFQLKYALYFILFSFFSASVFYFTFYIWSLHFVETILKTEVASPEISHVIDLFLKRLTEVNWLFIAYVLLSIIFSSITAIVVTHRVAGPMIAIKRVVAEFKNGNVNVRFSFRQRGDLKNIEDDLNDLLDLARKGANLNEK